MAGKVIAGGPVGSRVLRAIAPVIRVAGPAGLLGGDWQNGGSFFELVNAETHAASVGADSMCFTNRYGNLKLPEAAAFSHAEPQSLSGRWVQLALLGDQGAVLAWTGRVVGEERELYGASPDRESSGAEVVRGRQTWTALGPLHLLDRVPFSESLHLVLDEVRQIGWVPGFNEADRRGLVVGNRSAAQVEGLPGELTAFEGLHLFGGLEVWSRLEAVRYLLAHVSARTGIPFKVAGQVELLAQPLPVVRLQPTQTCRAVLDDLIPRSAGMDFRVVPMLEPSDGDLFGTVVGFQVHVFALLGVEVTFRGVTLPRNPTEVSLQVGTDLDLVRCNLVRDASQGFNRIRLLGRRVVVCSSLRQSEHVGGDDASATLAEAWTDDLRSAYERGDLSENPTTGSAEKHDAYRRLPRFNAVFQRLTAPRPWARGPDVSPAFDGAMQATGLAAPTQEIQRETLSWLPLREGVDYSDGGAVDDNPAGTAAEQLRPFVIGSDTEAERAQEGTPLNRRKCYTLVSAKGVGVHALKADLGIQLQATPNHLLDGGRGPSFASHKYDGTDPLVGVSKFHPSVRDPDSQEYLWTTRSAIRRRSLVATVAWQGDNRFALEFAVDESQPGEALEVYADEAELWWLAPNTVVSAEGQGGSQAGELLTSGSAGRALRNDADRMALSMAGLLARHVFHRGRAELVCRNLRAFGPLVGTVLGVIDNAGDAAQIASPITSVILTGGKEPSTLIRAGYHRS